MAKGEVDFGLASVINETKTIQQKMYNTLIISLYQQKALILICNFYTLNKFFFFVYLIAE